MSDLRNITHDAPNVSSTGNGFPYCHSTLGRAASPEGKRRRRAQLVALLYRHGGGMSMRELLAHPDCPPLAETIIGRHPAWFVVGKCNVRLAWVDPNRIKTARRRAGGAA